MKKNMKQKHFVEKSLIDGIIYMEKLLIGATKKLVSSLRKTSLPLRQAVVVILKLHSSLKDLVPSYLPRESSLPCSRM